MKINFLIICLTALICVSCKKINDKNPALMGAWQGTEWTIMDKPGDMDASQVQFEFREDGTYNAQFGSQKQNGTWRTEKDKLYTTETGKKEIMVKLLQATGARLEFEMNRGGQKEVLKLIKK
ncbi:MAG: lipocalin family protein [Saprospiraceae bacterium]|nr:lipocalin family protein [Saprospiraceae bacterium]